MAAGALAAALLLAGTLEAAAIQIDIVSSAIEEAPGAFVTHVFRVISDALTPTVYAIEYGLPTGWQALGAQTSVELQPGEEKSLFVTMTIPSGASAGAIRIPITVTSTDDAADAALAEAEVIVQPINEIELVAPSGSTAAQGQHVAYDISVANRGNAQDSYVIEARSSLGFDVSISTDAIDLAPQERVTIRAEFTVPADAGSGRDILTVSVSSVLYDAVTDDVSIFTTVLPPPPEAIGGTLMEELPARIRLSLDKDVFTGTFASRLSFSFSGQILGGFFSSNLSVTDPLGSDPAKIGSFSALYRRQPTTTSIGSVSVKLTDLIRVSCKGGAFEVDEEIFDLKLIAGGQGDDTRFGGYASFGPEVAYVGIAYFGERDTNDDYRSIWSGNAEAEPLEDWTIRIEGALGVDGPLTSRAFFLNTTIDTNAYFLSANVFSVGTHFPGSRADSAGIEISQRLRLSSLSLSVSLEHAWDNVIGDPLASTLIRDELGLNLNTTPLEGGPKLSLTSEFVWDRYPDITTKNDLDTLLSVGMSDTAGVFPYAFSGKVTDQIDHVLGTHIRTSTFSEGAGLSTDLFYLFLQLTQEKREDLIAATVLSSTSDVSLRFRPQDSRHEASIIFRNTVDDFSLSASLSIDLLDDLDVVFDGSIGWDRADADDISFGWGITFNATIEIPIPFFVTKGRIEGRAFIDRDGDGLYGINDEPAAGIVIGAGQSEVSTNAEGIFRFPPFYPNTYSVGASELPIDAASPGPISVNVAAGRVESVDIALTPIVVLTGRLFDDENRNGAVDEQEGGFDQVRMLLVDADRDVVIGETLTGMNGAFAFADIATGRYAVSVDDASLPDRFEFTTDPELTVDVLAEAQPVVLLGGYVRPRDVIVTFQPPTADFEFEPAEPLAGEPVSFDGTFSFDFDGTILAYAWDFDGDGANDASTPTAEFTFPAAGSYVVSLTVLDDGGNSDTVARTIVVLSPAPDVTPVEIPTPDTAPTDETPTDEIPTPDDETTEPPSTLVTPLAEFAYSPAEPAPGEPALFNGLLSSDADGSIVAYAWDFDADGTIDATEPLAEFAFPAAGAYAVSLTVTDDAGNRDTVTYTVRTQATAEAVDSGLLQLPIASFVYLPTEPVPGQPIEFNGTGSIDLDGMIVAFAWDFDADGDIDSTEPIAEHAFAVAGMFDVALTVTDDADNTDTIVLSIQIGEAQTDTEGPATTALQPPIAEFSFAPSAPTAGQSVLFNGALSTDFDGQVVAFAWDFDADGTIDATGAIAEHTFVDAGSLPVALTVTDDSGNTDTVTLTVPVSPEPTEAPTTAVFQPPIAEFSYSPGEPGTGQPVLFNGTLSTDFDGAIEAHVWDFDGDGTYDAVAAIVEYAYAEPGTYDVFLTVIDDSGSRDTLSLPITVDGDSVPTRTTSSFQPPIADFSYTPADPQPGDRIVFDGTLSADFDGAIAIYEWDLDNDGRVDSTAALVETSFAEAGTYPVSLTVTDDGGSTDRLTLDVTVGAAPAPGGSSSGSFQPPVAEFAYMPAHPVVGDPVLFNGTFSSDFDGDIVAYAWDFNGDGTTDASGAMVERTFTTPGLYQVSLTVTDDGGNRDTVTYPITID